MRLRWTPPKLPKQIIATHSWHEFYAADVHNGQMLKSGTVLPSRPWTEPPLAEMDLARIVAENFRRSQNLNQAFVRANTLLGEAFDQSMESEVWSWPRDTYRVNGDVVGSPRDIIDTGALMDSRSLDFTTIL